MKGRYLCDFLVQSTQKPWSLVLIANLGNDSFKLIVRVDLFLSLLGRERVPVVGEGEK
jgi:hypothetical protein